MENKAVVQPETNPGVVAPQPGPAAVEEKPDSEALEQYGDLIPFADPSWYQTVRVEARYPFHMRFTNKSAVPLSVL